MKIRTLTLILVIITCARFGFGQNEVISGHLAVGNAAAIDGGPSGADHRVIDVEEVRTDIDRNVIGITCVTGWVPVSNPPTGRGVGCVDALTIAGPDAGQTITYLSNFSANSQGAAGKTGTVTQQWGYFAEQPLMNSVNVGTNYGVHIKDQGANASGSGTITYGCALCVEPQTQDALVIKGGRNSIAGSFGLPPTIYSTDHTAAGESIMLVSAYSNNVSIYLPSAAVDYGRQYTIKRVDTTGHTLTVRAFGSELIDGATTKQLGGYQSISITSAVSGWFILATYP